MARNVLTDARGCTSLLPVRPAPYVGLSGPADFLVDCAPRRLGVPRLMESSDSFCFGIPRTTPGDHFLISHQPTCGSGRNPS